MKIGQISSEFTVIIPKTNVYLEKAVLVKCRKNKKQKKNCQKKPKRILNGTTKLKKCQDKTYVRKKKQFWRLMGTVPCSLTQPFIISFITFACRHLSLQDSFHTHS